MTKKSLGAGTFAVPTPVWCVGSYDELGKANVATIAWGGICCGKPPCLTISFRKATYSYGCIMNRKAYTVSIPSAKYIKEADYFGMVSGRDVDKFAKTGLTPIRSILVDAPYVKEFPLILECKVVDIFELGLHTQFIGEIVDVKVDESALDGQKHFDLAAISPLLYSPNASIYSGVGEQLGKAFSIGKAF